MIRKQIYLEAGQDKLLKRLARRQHISEAEFIRRSLEAQIEAFKRQQEREALWAKEDAFIRQLMDQGPVPGGRNWRRQDLYDRPGKWNK